MQSGEWQPSITCKIAQVAAFRILNDRGPLQLVFGPAHLLDNFVGQGKKYEIYRARCHIIVFASFVDLRSGGFLA
jgi:hypothetical protein